MARKRVTFDGKNESYNVLNNKKAFLILEIRFDLSNSENSVDRILIGRELAIIWSDVYVCIVKPLTNEDSNNIHVVLTRRVAMEISKGRLTTNKQTKKRTKKQVCKVLNTSVEIISLPE